MSGNFHDINLPGRSSPKKEEQPEKRLITGVDESELEDEQPEPELRLISSEWKAGPKGFQHNEQCFLEVKAEYLKKTIRSRIRGRLFGMYDGQEVDLCQEVYGHVEKDGIALMDIQHLWFVNHRHYHAWRKDKSVPSSYMIKKIQHSRGVNMIDSPVLEMPHEAEPLEKNVKLEFRYPAASPHKQYVNLPADGKDRGAELKIIVKADGAEDGDLLLWILEASGDNSKRDDHIPFLRNNETVHIKDGSAKILSPVLDGYAEIVLGCGVCGGDSFLVKVSYGKECAELTVNTWRSFRYQMTHQKGLAIPAINNTIAAFNNVFAEMKQDNKKEFDEADLEPLTRRNINTFYREWVIDPGGSDRIVAVIGSHNRDFFYNYFQKNAQCHPKVHLIICQHQWDDAGFITDEMIVKLNQKNSSEFDMGYDIFSPHLKGNLVARGTWRSLSGREHPDFGKNGNITDEWIVVERNRTSRKHIKIKIPDKIDLNPDNTAPIEVKFKLRTVAGPYLGESNLFQIMAVFDPSYVTGFNNTLTHEIGHAFNQVPEPSKSAPGLPEHPNQYTGHGGIGSQCNTIIDGSGQETRGTLGAGGVYQTGVCVMFHAGKACCINRFCSFCEPYVKATDFSDFKKR